MHTPPRTFAPHARTEADDVDAMLDAMHPRDALNALTATRFERENARRRNTLGAGGAVDIEGGVIDDEDRATLRRMAVTTSEEEVADASAEGGNPFREASRIFAELADLSPADALNALTATRFERERARGV